MNEIVNPWDALLPDGARAGIYAYKYRHLIQSYWSKAQVMSGLGEPSIVVTGRAGTGKSVLVSHVHGEANKRDWQMPDTSTDVEIKSIPIGEWAKIVSVIPGQNNRERAKGLDQVFNQVENLDGVIHVVDWGYTAVRNEVIKKQLIENEGLDSIWKMRQHNLSQELKDFESVLDKIAMAKASGRGPKWLMIAVNKVDLFNDDKNEVALYYHPDCTGEFSSKINELYLAIGGQNIRIGCVPVCSMLESFNWNNETITPQLASTQIQRNYLRIFVDRVAILHNGST